MTPKLTEALELPEIKRLVDALRKAEKAKNADDWQDFIDADDEVVAALAAIDGVQP